MLSILASGCTLNRMMRQAKDQQITVQPNPLVANAQQVDFELKASVPAKLIKDGYPYKLNVFYTYGQMEQEQVGTLNFEFGEFLYENGRPTITRQLSFPYDPKKNEGTLFVQGMAIDKGKGKTKLGKPQPVAKGLNTTPLLMVRQHEIAFAADAYAEAAGKPAVLMFYYGHNDLSLKSALGSTLQVLDQYTYDNVPTQEITITGGQSPDEAGTNLAQKRAKKLEELYRKNLNIHDYSNKKVTVKTAVRQNQWQELLQKVNTSALSSAQKQEVNQIIGSTTSDKEKAAALRASTANAYLQQYVYPVMRYGAVEINYNRSRKADYEVYLLAKQVAEQKVGADVLTEEELQYAASLTPLLAEKRKLYEAAIKTTDKWPAYYNLGKVYVEMARKEYRPKAKQALLASAIHNLTFAGYRNPTAPVYYGLASAYHLHGDKLEALQYYDYALKLGGDQEQLQRVFADKASLEIEIGQYDDAIESLTYAGDSYHTNMNMGLSYLLKENYEGAERYYQKALALKPNDALANYSMAVIGAREKNEQKLVQHLRRSVRADAAFTQKAIQDIEFSAYKSSTAFRDALTK